MSLRSLIVLNSTVLATVTHGLNLTDNHATSNVCRSFIQRIARLPGFGTGSGYVVALTFVAPHISSPVRSGAHVTAAGCKLPPTIAGCAIPNTAFDGNTPVALSLT